MKIKISLVFFMTILFINNTNAQNKEAKKNVEKISLSEALEIAINQKTLCQRMAKDKLYIEARRNKTKADRELDRTINAFNEGIERLKTFSPTEEIKLKIAVQEYTFETYRTTILKTSKKSMYKIVKTNTLFLNICNDLVKEFSAYSRSINPNLNSREIYARQQIDNFTKISGTISYNTQRLALYYSLKSFEITEVDDRRIIAIINKISSDIKTLTISEFNTLEIDDALSELVYYWSKLKSQILNKERKLIETTEDFAEIELFEATNTVLDKANEMIRLYSKLNDI